MTGTREHITDADLRTLADAVAVELTEHTGDAWTVSQPFDHAHTLHMTRATDGARLWFGGATVYAQRGRVRVAFANPEDVEQAHRAQQVDSYEHHIERVELTAAPDRPARAIARDVARRLLPSLAEETQKVRERVAATVARRDVQAATVAELAGILGVPATNHRGEPMTSLFWHPKGSGYLRAEVRESGTVGLDRCTLTAKQAAAVFAVLADMADD